MRALKALVVVMGILIVLGVTVIAVTIVNRLSRSAAPESASAAFGTVRVAVPPGGRVVGGDSNGGRLVVHLAFPGGTARFLVVDLATGRNLGTIEFAADGNP